MQIFDDPRRLRLSGMAAAGADVQPQLRLLMLAEALAASPTHRALDLSAETAVLCTAASEAVRRRPGLPPDRGAEVRGSLYAAPGRQVV